MTRPGTQISTVDVAPSGGVVTKTGTWFVTGLAEKGSVTKAIAVRNMSEFTRLCGPRVSYSILFDALDTFFHEGGKLAYVGRVVGPDAVASTANLFSASGNDIPDDVSLIATATSPGEWGDALRVSVIEGVESGFRIVVGHATDGTLSTSPDLADRDAAVAWAEANTYITLSLGASEDTPDLVSNTALSGGDDDRGNVGDTERQNAYSLFTRDLGPGQVSEPGLFSSNAHARQLNHAEEFNRVAVLDGENTANISDLTGDVALHRNVSFDKDGGFFAPWVKVPGVVPNTSRTVPASALYAGLVARNDSAGRQPNVPAAGEMGKARYAFDVTQTWTDADRETLNTGGVNVVRAMLGGVRVYGNRTLVNPDTKPNRLQLANARQHMAIAAKADAIAELHAFAQIDGAGVEISKFGADLRAMLVPMWEAGALYGATFEEAARVDVGDTVNTPETIQAGELHAVIYVRLSPGAELVAIDIAKLPITESVA